MINMKISKNFIFAILSGYVGYYFLKLFWGYSSIYVPVNTFNEWTTAFLPSGNKLLIDIVIFTRDFLINLLLIFPFTIAFKKLTNSECIIAILIVIVPTFIYDYQYVLSLDLTGIVNFFSLGIGAMYGLLVTLGLLPLAVLLNRKISQRGKVNNV